jgi:TRAP-type C4-dicarboxylate transport system permease small subunit
MLKLLDRIDNAWAACERWLIAALLLAMLALAFSQVVLRNLFSTGLDWADVTVRHLVLWVGLLGASVAAKERRHLAIDIAPRILTGKARQALEALLGLITAGICGLLFWASWRFASFLYEFGTGTLEGAPALLAGLILPVAFAGIAVRFLLIAIREIAALAAGPKGGG